MNSRNWYQLLVPVIPETVDAVSNFLFEQGAAGAEEQEHAVLAYFPESIDQQTLLKNVKKYLNSLSSMGLAATDKEILITEIKDRDWNSEWKAQFKPFNVTDNIMIKPTWCELPKTHPEIVIEMDPEMAFGTGTHATTALCARLLEDKVKNKTVLDAGTGTGILAIIAQKLGAKHSTAFDIDPIASETARKNADKNKVDNINIFTGTTQSVVDQKFDVIAANINSGQILNILGDFYQLLYDNGVLILSGILDSEKEKLNKALLDNHFEIQQLLHREEWIAFECIKTIKD